MGPVHYFTPAPGTAMSTLAERVRSSTPLSATEAKTLAKAVGEELHNSTDNIRVANNALLDIPLFREHFRSTVNQSVSKLYQHGDYPGYATRVDEHHLKMVGKARVWPLVAFSGSIVLAVAVSAWLQYYLAMQAIKQGVSSALSQTPVNVKLQKNSSN